MPSAICFSETIKKAQILVSYKPLKFFVGEMPPKSVGRVAAPDSE